MITGGWEPISLSSINRLVYIASTDRREPKGQPRRSHQHLFCESAENSAGLHVMSALSFPKLNKATAGDVKDQRRAKGREPKDQSESESFLTEAHPRVL